MELIVTGDLAGVEGFELGAELWRVPFRAWDENHRLLATSWCRPLCFFVVDEQGQTVASGYTEDPTVLPGEVFSLRVKKPPPAP